MTQPAKSRDKLKNLIIVGASGFGREVLVWANDTLSGQPDWAIGGFLDANPMALGELTLSARVVGDPDTYRPTPNDRFVCAIGDPLRRLSICRSMENRGATFTTLIHPTAVVGQRCRIGKGSIVCPGVVITADATVGDHVIVNVHSSIGHNAIVGDGCTLSGHCDVTGYARLGEGVFLGSHAAVLPSIRVGDYARIGAGSVALRNVPSGVTVMGVPAKRI